jgi:hypothetical protein
MRSTIAFFLAVLVVGCGDPTVGHIRRTRMASSTNMQLHGPTLRTETIELDLPRGFTLPKITAPTLEDDSGHRYRATKVSLSSSSSSGKQTISATFNVDEHTLAAKMYVGDLVIDLHRSEVRHVSSAAK